MRGIAGILFCLAAWGAEAQFKNIKLTETDSPQKPGIAMHHKNPENIVAGFGSGLILFSKDDGKTWQEGAHKLPFGIAGGVSVHADAKGDLFFFHLSDPDAKGKTGMHDRIVCQASEDGGKSWSDGVSIGMNASKSLDRPSVWVHPKKQILYMTWSQIDQPGSTETTCQSNILFSMSTNGGSKWSKPFQINKEAGTCLENDYAATGPSPVAGNDGRVYTTWSNKGSVFLDRSYNGGETWLTTDLSIIKEPAGWALTIPGFGRNLSFPVLLVDNSMSRLQGCLYLAFADQHSGKDDTDVWVVRSLDRGDHWTAPTRVNSDKPGKHQFAPSISIDQSSGHIFLVYFDRREYDDLQTDVYLAYSLDGGSTFKDIKISESPFTPSSKFQAGYTAISAQGGVIAPLWTRTDGDKVGYWTAIIHEDQLPKK